MMSVRRAIPNGLTAASFLLALFSVVSSELGQLERAAWLIVWCVLLDIADGVVARLLKGTSEFGADFDSFADLAAFGIAPAALVLHLYWRGGSVLDWRLGASCASYALLAAIRLARFNSTAPAQAGWFRGVPSTACGALVATSVILLVRHHNALGAFDGSVALLVLLPILGLAMVSELRFPKLRLTASRPLNMVHAVTLTGVYVCGALRVWPEYLFGAAVMLVIAGLAEGFRGRAHA